MPNTQLGLFDGQISPPDKKVKRIRRNNGWKIDAIANQILREMKTETKETRQAVVCEMYYLTIREKLDLMPRRCSVNLVVKLIERYFT